LRKITSAQIAVFFLLFGSILFLGIATAYGLLGALPLGDFRGVTVVGGAVVFVYLYGFAATGCSCG